MNTQPDDANLVLGASWMIPQPGAGNSTTACYRDYGLHVANGKIVQCAPFAELASGFTGQANCRVEFFDGHILMPGLVNCHGHAAMSLLRGFADDYPLQQWLEQFIWPTEAQWLDEQYVRDGSTLAMAEMLLSGTTTFSDMYFFPDATAAAAEALGMRAQVNFPIIAFPSAWAQDTEEYFAKGLELFDNYRHSQLIKIGFAPHAPYTVDDADFARVAVLAEEIDTHIQVHLQETAAEIADSMRDHGCSPVARLHRLGVLGPRTQAVHLCHFDSDDLALLAQSNTSVVHCPASNAKLASGYCNISKLLESGLRLGLGTDSAASNNSLDLFDSMRLAALLAKHHAGDATALQARQALHLATQGGADALGIGEQTGSLAVGKYADIIAIDTRQPALQPLYNPASQLVYTQAANAVNHVWVAGRQVVKARQLVDLDLQQVLANAASWREKISDIA